MDESHDSDSYDGDVEGHGHAADTNLEPQNYRAAMRSPESFKWEEAMNEEITMHLANNTWDIVDLPPGQKAIGSTWVFRIKHHADGSIERFKARVCAQGFSQRPGFDFLETYASTLRWSSLRVVLALAAIEDMELRSVDISHAFVNSDIDTVVYMKQPEGFRQGGPEKVCRLNKSLYGLKQSPRLWSEKLCGVLVKLGFRRLESDPCVYMFQRDNLKVIVPVWVDDITLASKDSGAIDQFIIDLQKELPLRDLGNTTFLLGMGIRRDRENRKLYLSARQYILRKLEEFKMQDAKPVHTPINPNVSLSKEDCPKTPEELEEMRNVPYMSAVGSLLFLAMIVRPDIAYACSVLTRFNSNPGKAHWVAVKHLWRYLLGTIDLELELGPDPDATNLLTVISDSDLGGNKDNGKSTTGYIIKVGSGAVSWSSKLQPVVTLSSTEAEFVASNAAGKEALAIRSLLNELGYKVPSPTPLLVDNQSSIQVSKNPEHHGRMKHLDRSYFWLREQVMHKKIAPSYLPTEDNPADLLTKALVKPKVEKFRSLIGLVKPLSVP
jgi:hypothetical protein